jgi:hypothetical protein
LNVIVTGPAPIIVTALFGRQDTAFFDAMRREHFPPERNQLDAHLTLFHHLPPSGLDELKHRLNQETRGIRAPQARIGGLMSLGRGVAYRIESPELVSIRARLADALRRTPAAGDRTSRSRTRSAHKSPSFCSAICNAISSRRTSKSPVWARGGTAADRGKRFPGTCSLDRLETASYRPRLAGKNASLTDGTAK